MTDEAISGYREAFRRFVGRVFPEAVRKTIAETEWVDQRAYLPSPNNGRERRCCPLGAGLFLVGVARGLPVGYDDVVVFAGVPDDAEGSPLEDRVAVGRFISLWDKEIIEPEDLSDWFGLTDGDAEGTVSA